MPFPLAIYWNINCVRQTIRLAYSIGLWAFLDDKAFFYAMGCPTHKVSLSQNSKSHFLPSHR